MAKKKEGKSRPILVPVDFSPASAAALAWAAEVSRLIKVPLEVLHVVHDPESAPGYYAQSKRKGHLRRFEELAAEMMEDFLEKCGDEHPEVAALNNLKTTLVVGLPNQRILEIADARPARMIVMGSQGRTGLPRLLLGSKAERVVQLAPMPVTIVKVAKSKEEKP